MSNLSSPDVEEPNMIWVLDLFGLHGPAYDDMTDAEKVEKLEQVVIQNYESYVDYVMVMNAKVERANLRAEAIEDIHQKHLTSRTVGSTHSR